MADVASTGSNARRYDVALSFAGEDRQYVDRVAAALVRAGISVFYDRYEEATLWGKNLYDHLQSVYSEASAYTVLFVSAAYAGKLWTNHERQSAQSRAFAERREYILPARFDDTQVPGLLPTTGYVDLTRKTPEEFADLIIQKLRHSGLTNSESDRDTLRRVPLFGAALQELKSHGSVSIAIMEALLQEDTPPPCLAEFLLILVRESHGSARLGLGKFAILFVDKFDVGYEAVLYCLQTGALDDRERELLGMGMQNVVRPDGIRWAHERLTRDIRSDTYYNSFLQKHLKFVLHNLSAEMTAYLLVPNRGPSNCNIESMFLVARKFSKPGPFITRIQDWITDGSFDGRRTECTDDVSNQTDAGILYSCLNELADLPNDHPLQALRAFVCDRTRRLLKSGDAILGLYHLWMMRAENFIDTDNALHRVYDLASPNEDAQKLFFLLRNSAIDQLGEARSIAQRLQLL